MPRLSIRVRLTLWYATVLGILLVAFSAAVYVALDRSLQRNLDDTLERRAEDLLPLVVFSGGEPSLPDEVLDRYRPEDEDEPDDDDEADLDQDEEPWVRTRDRQGRVVSNGGASPSLPDLSFLAARVFEGGDAVRADLSDDGEPYRVLMVPVTRDGLVVGILEVGVSREEQAETLGALRSILAVAIPAAVLAATGGGMLLALRALRPIDRITSTARRISAADLSERLALDLPDDELGRLARTFDEMLGRLEAEFRRQRQFTADASHELRTPLTALKGHVDVALTRDRSTAEYRTVLERVNAEVDRLITLVGSLLLLARADAGQLLLRKESVDAGLLVETAIEHVRPLAVERGVDLAVEPGLACTFSGDETLLLQALLNLLDNALKHSVRGGAVTAGWAADPGSVRLAVSDTGVGIAASDQERIFDRFYRVDEARSREDGGTGLGLAIVKWIAEAHGGTVTVTSAPGKGATFTVALPPAV